MTDAQAAASNPGNKPVEQDVLTAAANLGKPIFIIEAGEHYENGFDANDPWYSPPTETTQRQFLIDLQTVQQGLPNNLGMGLEYWDATGVNIPSATGGFLNGDNQPNAIYTWNGLTLFDNADTSGITDVSASNYSALLTGIDGLGGALDSTLSYKFVNRATGQVLSLIGNSASSVRLSTALDDGNPRPSQRWRITSNKDGYFQIASVRLNSGRNAEVLHNSKGLLAHGDVSIYSAVAGATEQEWNIVSAGEGYFFLVNRLSGLVLDIDKRQKMQAASAVQEIRSASAKTQQWRIVPVR